MATEILASLHMGSCLLGLHPLAVQCPEAQIQHQKRSILKPYAGNLTVENPSRWVGLGHSKIGYFRLGSRLG